MAENKQGALNGAYYGPSIPPSESNNRSGRGCCCCFLSVLWKILLGIVILAGLAILILYLVLQPQKFKIHVTNATLTEFNLANTTTAHPNIYYSLALDMAVRNPNKKFGVYFEKVEARVSYESHRITQKNIDNFFLKKKSGINHKLNFKGQTLFLLSASDLKEFNGDKAAGVYKIDLKFRPQIRYRLGDFIFNQYLYPKVKCGMKVPLKGSNNSSSSAITSFKTTKCDVNFIFL